MVHFIFKRDALNTPHYTVRGTHYAYVVVSIFYLKIKSKLNYQNDKGIIMNASHFLKQTATLNWWWLWNEMKWNEEKEMNITYWEMRFTNRMRLEDFCCSRQKLENEQNKKWKIQIKCNLYSMSQSLAHVFSFPFFFCSLAEYKAVKEIKPFNKLRQIESKSSYNQSQALSTNITKLIDTDHTQYTTTAYLRTRK